MTANLTSATRTIQQDMSASCRPAVFLPAMSHQCRRGTTKAVKPPQPCGSTNGNGANRLLKILPMLFKDLLCDQSIQLGPVNHLRIHLDIGGPLIGQHDRIRHARHGQQLRRKIRIGPRRFRQRQP